VAVHFVEPRPEDEVLGDMARLIGGEAVKRIASLVWRIAFGEAPL